MSEVQKADGVVIIPTYNEKENVENIIRAVMELPHVFDVLIIDDGLARRYGRYRKTVAGR